jgi:hypothetical protein
VDVEDAAALAFDPTGLTVPGVADDPIGRLPPVVAHSLHAPYSGADG